jgi:hypothetical protein
MDPIRIVGLASSIMQPADALFKIMRVLDTIKEGGQDCRRLCDEISVLWMILRSLEMQFTALNAGLDISWKLIDALAELNGTLEQLQTALNDVREKVPMSESKSEGDITLSTRPKLRGPDHCPNRTTQVFDPSHHKSGQHRSSMGNARRRGPCQTTYC